jgi:hypothetical protein
VDSRRTALHRHQGAPIYCAVLAILTLTPLGHRTSIRAITHATPWIGRPATHAFARLPLAFEVNKGQTDASVKYLAHGPGYTLFLTDAGAVLSLSGRAGMPPNLGDGPGRVLPVTATRPSAPEAALRLWSSSVLSATPSPTARSFRGRAMSMARR